MANRPVFCSIDEYPYVKQVDIDFEFFSGFSISQKQKCIKSLHESFNSIYPKRKVLEVSSKSYQDKGIEFSAFNLKKYVKQIDSRVSVENIFQSSKVFEDGGPYRNLLLVSAKEAKKEIRNHDGSLLKKFNFEDYDYPLVPRTFFFDYIYMNALLENKELIDILIQYDSFTDIEFNPNKSINCQAKACATFVSLYRLNKLDILDCQEKCLCFILNR